MELLPIIVGVQELLLAALILYAIPAPKEADWQAGACQRNDAFASSHILMSPAAPSGSWTVQSGVYWLGAVSCLMGYVLGLYISNWDLRPRLSVQSKADSSGSAVATADHTRLKCVQYYQCFIQLVCGAVATATTALAEKLSELARQAADAATAAGAAAAAVVAAAALNQPSKFVELDVAESRCCSADWAAAGASSCSSSAMVLFSDCNTAGMGLAEFNTESTHGVARTCRLSHGGDVSIIHLGVPVAVHGSDVATEDSNCNEGMHISNSSATATATAAAPALLQQLASAITERTPACNEHLSAQSPQQHLPLQMQHLQCQQMQLQMPIRGLAQQQPQQQQRLWPPRPPSRQQRQWQHEEQQEPALLPLCSAALNQSQSLRGSNESAALQPQLSHTPSRANAAVTPLGCGWKCVLSCSQPNAPSLLQLQDSLMWQQGVVCNTVQQEGVPGEDISLSVVLGAGAYGKVYKGQWRGQPVAVKILYHTGSCAAAKVAEEAAIMLQAKHENVICTHHVLMWQRSKSGNSSMHPNSNFLSSNCVESNGRAAVEAVAPSDCRKYSTSGSSTPVCGVIEETQEGEAGGWLQCGHDGIEDDDIEAQTWIVLELCDGGPLDVAVRDGRIAGVEQVLACLLEVARGLEYLHNRGLVHGDLKAANVCLVNIPPQDSQAPAVASIGPHPASAAPSIGSSRRGSGSSSAGKDFVCKVMDFSLTRALDPGKTHCSTYSFGTVTHVAPELLTSGKQSKAADVYSYGMLVWEVLNKGKLPYQGLHSVDIVQRILHQQQRPEWEADADPQLVAIAEQCCSADPTQRPLISKVCEQLLQLQQALQRVKESSILSTTYSSTAEAAAVAVGERMQEQQHQQQLGWSLSAPLPDLCATAAVPVDSSRSFPLPAVDSGCASGSSTSASYCGTVSSTPALNITRNPGVLPLGTNGGGVACMVLPPAAAQVACASTAHAQPASQPATAARLANISLTGPAAADHGGGQDIRPSTAEVVIMSSSCVSDSGSSSSNELTNAPKQRQPPVRSFSFSHIASQPAALQPIPEGIGVESDLLDFKLRIAPDQQGLQAVRPNDQASLAIARTRVQMMHGYGDQKEGPDCQAGLITDQAAIQTMHQAHNAAVRASNQAGLESVTGTWKMRRHSHCSVGRALRAAATTGSVAAPRLGKEAPPTAAAASAGGSPVSSVDSAAHEPWEGVVATGRKGLIRGVDCSALDDKELPSTRQQQRQQQEQEQRRPVMEVAAVSHIAAVAPLTSAGDSIGPMVGYWD